MSNVNSDPRLLAKTRWREFLLALLLAALLAATLAYAPGHQPEAYHAFADARTLLGVANLLNVASNVAFVLVGLYGLALRRSLHPSAPVLSWTVLGLSAMLVGLGSAYYHLAPSNATLVWDRLPMALGFAALFTAIVCEHTHAVAERWLLAPALAVGIASVLWWHAADDLRLYLWVQFAPLLCLPVVLALFRGRYSHRWVLLVALALYAVAKVAESIDGLVLEVTGRVVSGHTLKHLLAAGALLAVFLMLRRRELRP